MLDLMSKNEYLMMRTAIICTNAEEAEDLNTFLILTKKTLLIHDKMKSSAIRSTMTNFNHIKKCFILYLTFYFIVDLINSVFAFLTVTYNFLQLYEKIGWHVFVVPIQY